jgi:hypothetical protein
MGCQLEPNKVYEFFMDLSPWAIQELSGDLELQMWWVNINVSCKVMMRDTLQGFRWWFIFKPYTEQPKWVLYTLRTWCVLWKVNGMNW